MIICVNFNKLVLLLFIVSFLWYLFIKKFNEGFVIIGEKVDFNYNKRGIFM